mgnify:CR=1 FL=1
MFGIGGWKQVGATFDMKRQAAIREQLDQAGIEYQVKNRLKSGVLSGNQRARLGSAGENAASEREYLFYVQKAEEEKARRVIESAGR